MLGISANLIAKFCVNEKGNKTMSVSVDNGTPSMFEYFEPMTGSKQYAKDYTGRHELESTLDILIRDEKLVGHHGRHGDFSNTNAEKRCFGNSRFSYYKI